MENMIFEKTEDVISNMNTGNKQKDLETINAVLSGNIQIGNQEEPKIELENVEQNKKENIPEQVVPIIDNEEVERQKLYIEMIEKRRLEEKEQLLLEKREKEEEIAKERKIREDLEKRIREIEIRKQNEPNLSQSVEEVEEEYTSDYNKTTRKMVENLKQDLGNNPEFTKLFERIGELEGKLEKDDNERKRIKEQEKLKEETEKVFNGLRNFMNEYPEYKTNKDIRKIDEEYQNFRKDIAYISKVRSSEELDAIIYEYRNGGKIKEIASKNGIIPPEDFEKYESIADLVDFKNGFEFNPSMGRRVPILDENGIQIRYRNLNEAYNIKNYHDNLSKAKRQAYKEVNEKLTQFNNAPVTLKNDITETFSTGLTLDQEKEILNMDPREWSGNSEKTKLVEIVYSKMGLEMPKYRGKRN